MTYTVQPGDSLWSIAARKLGDGTRWREIARRNMLKSPGRLVIGQKLFLPERSAASTVLVPGAGHEHHAPIWGGTEKRPAMAPVQVHLFFLADEVNPLKRKLVRKVGIPKKPVSAELLEQILHPDKHGFSPIDPTSNVSIGRHVGQNMTNSRYISTSERPFGTPRFPEQKDRYWIDAERAEASGVKFHETAAILQDLDRLIDKARAQKNDKLVGRLEHIRKLSSEVDREVLLEGHVPAGAVKGATAMGLTRGFQVVEGVGLALSIYDLGKAGKQSVREHSIVPIASETGRQAGGWAGAWAGAELGGSVGALFGIETGPGAILTGAVGAAIFGTAGFFGADWAVKRMGGR